MCGVCAIWKLVRSVITLRLNYVMHGIQLILFFYAWNLCIDQLEQEQRGATPVSDWNRKNGWTQQGQYFKANSTPNHSFAGLFFILQHRNINTSRKTTSNNHLHWKTRWMKPFWQCALASRDCYMWNSATLNCCVCVASGWVQTLVACVCHSACADTWYWHLSPYLESHKCTIGLKLKKMDCVGQKRGQNSRS